MPSPLTYKTLWTRGIPAYTPGQNLTFSPSTFTLLLGPRSAILVDTPLTITRTSSLAAWITSHLDGRTLTHVYITHGHADHVFGLPVLEQHFPGLRGLATEAVLAHVAQQLEPASLEGVWLKYFPGGQIADQSGLLGLIDRVPGDGKILLDGHEVRAVSVGQADTDHSTVLFVPELGLVAAGDVVYGNAYQYFGDTTTREMREEWLESVRKVEKLGPRVIVSAHRQEGDSFDAEERIRLTREYIVAWGEELKVAKTAEELKERMVKRFPERIGDFILDLSANVNMPGSSASS